ncbi:hypothetical protein [Algoriphagus hitonicola]|uniref:Uncharacterized protein n=1 Tax=Algoriphagus hitonicola TaxID=435880 RepID=A0A1I2REK6_9BACT|nr:hypothetical protein [Algoriphagus hitonicola]SFG36186.1 hypothetical protein SAMN04487988_10396 [Algoriphagus hitonicola]
MDLGNIIYIVAILAYFIYQATRKKSQEGGETELPEGNPSRPEKEVTFEDLLREIRGEQNQSPKPAPKPIPQTKFEETKVEKLEKPTTRYRSLEEQDDEIQYYEGAFENVDFKGKKSSPGIPDIQTVGSEHHHRARVSRKSKYAALLKNSSSVKEAMVLKEILDRKHF